MIGASSGFGQHELLGVVTKSTDSALLILVDGYDEKWVPRSVCLDGADIDDGDEDVFVADWWLKKEGLL